jgi:hypothetical protein
VVSEATLSYPPVAPFNPGGASPFGIQCGLADVRRGSCAASLRWILCAVVDDIGRGDDHKHAGRLLANVTAHMRLDAQQMEAVTFL